jgi:hypothetical protein
MCLHGKEKKKKGAKQECQMEENKTDNVICISHRTKKQKQEMGIIDNIMNINT